MRGNRNAQDYLLDQVNRNEMKGVGADIMLNQWDANRGTWDDVEILPNNGAPPIQVYVYDYNNMTGLLHPEYDPAPSLLLHPEYDPFLPDLEQQQ